MKIFSFDSGIKNLGFCFIEYDQDWKNIIATLNNKLTEFYNKIDQYNKEQCVEKITYLLYEIDNELSNIINIRYINCIDISGDNNISNSRKLKSFLLSIDETFGIPDIILSEYQMGPNDLARNISSQILQHYVDNSETFDTLIKDDVLKCSKQIKSPKFIIVPPSLKNKYSFSEEGKYSNFLVKYSTNYTANKSHSTYNFKLYVDKMCPHIEEKIKNIKKSYLDDMADAFMMNYNWIRENATY